ncbi:uncharacterized protein LOC110895212 [Helianthus annuus]|uniref:uncharacterized protein LOC110895212 n=1 Tax=Helianthus annuus TaxID=4232 RepID=UPI000B907594|nr:uncharacterized protein LOC110895212 [Helianthus annuus]
MVAAQDSMSRKKNRHHDDERMNLNWISTTSRRLHIHLICIKFLSCYNHSLINRWRIIDEMVRNRINSNINVLDEFEKFSDEDGKAKARCKHCSTVVNADKEKIGNVAMIRHLERCEKY